MPLFSHLPFLPVVTKDENNQLPSEDLLLPLARIAPILIPTGALKSILNVLPSSSEYWVLVEAGLQIEVLIALLDAGASRLVSSDISLLGQIPADRLVLALNPESLQELAAEKDASTVAQSVSGIFLETPLNSNSAGFDKSLIGTARTLLGGKASREAKDIYVVPYGDARPTLDQLDALTAMRLGTVACLPSTILSAQPPSTDSTTTAATSLPPKMQSGYHLPIDVLFLSSLSTDRDDALYATLVTAQGEPPLGLVYSSPLSISLSIITSKATYHSRSRNALWIKGATSGATQTVVAIRRDCDGDALEFIVDQKQGTGFCHTPKSASCFGPDMGIGALERTIRQRQAEAPAGSYTKRLFDNPNMLEAKIREEAEEVCQARTWEETRAEAADLLYFLLVRCTAQNVSLLDVKAILDLRAGKVTRRPGNAKAAFIKPSNGTTNGSQPSTSASAALEQTSTKLPAVIEGVPAQQGAKVQEDSIVPPVYDLSTLSKDQRAALLKRPLIESKEMLGKVQPILDQVKSDGDVALRKFVSTLDRCAAAAEHTEQKPWDTVLRAPFSQDLMQLSDETRKAIDTAFANIHLFHSKQMDKEAAVLRVETMPGIVCTRFVRPIDHVGLYIPGGTAVLPSTMMMLGIPALIAGCKHISVATPADKDGNVRPEIVYIAHKCGAAEIVRAGGAHAVAAMAYGTQSATKVDKIFGPGNQWVTAAKMAVSMDSGSNVSIDMPAGPSEVLVIADRTSNPIFVAADLLSQAEHGPDSQVVLLAVDLEDAHLEQIKDQISKQALALPRVDIVRTCISKSLIVTVPSRAEALRFSNDYAPEHLILHLEEAESALGDINNAGSVFVGEWSPESLGDYASGTNHTLPTYGYARQYSGVSTSSFLKHITSQELTKEGLQLLGPTVDHLARVEGLDAHARAVTLRLANM